MDKKDKFVIIGGDNRQLYMADYLEKMNFDVSVFALPETERACCKSLRNALESARFVVLPLPLTKDGRHVHTIVEKRISVDEIISLLNDKHVVFAGLISKTTEGKINKKSGKVYDYFKREEVTVRNTVPTFQGILKVIFDNINYTVNSSRCAVFGYGRVADITADMLKSLGADVTVCARKISDISRARIKGHKGCFIKDFADTAGEFDIIINTVPSPVISKDILEKVRRDCLIVDVASAPYGVDFAAADRLGINAILCPSLPGKAAPVTAGRIIADGILNIIEEDCLWTK